MSSAEWRDDVAALHALWTVWARKILRKSGVHIRSSGKSRVRNGVCSAGDTLTIIFANSASEGHGI